MKNIGLVGTGYWGPNVANSFTLTGQAKITWLCDLDEKCLRNLGKKYPEAKTTTRFEDLLEDDSLHGVAISTPVATHFSLCQQALEAGKDVLVEKPITSDSEQAIQLTRLAQEKNCILMVGHVFEYNATIRYLKKLVLEGELGEIYYIFFERTNLGPVRADVNVLWDLAAHDISVMCYLLDQFPKNVTARGESYLNPKVEDVAFASYSFAKKTMAHIHVSWINPRKVRQITLVGSKKMVVWDDLDLKSPVKIFDKRVELTSPVEEGFIENYLDYKTACVDGGMTIPSINLNQPLKAECEHFLQCLETRETPQPDGYIGYAVMRALEATRESMASQSVLSEIDIPSREELLS